MYIYYAHYYLKCIYIFIYLDCLLLGYEFNSLYAILKNEFKIKINEKIT